VVPLLNAWATKFNVPDKNWQAAGGAAEQVLLGSVWGDPRSDGEPERRPYFKPSGLSDGLCTIKLYMEEVLELRVPEAERALDPGWFDSMRKALRQCAKLAMEAAVSADQAETVFDEHFSEAMNGDHPHFEMYQRVGRAIVRGFATSFNPAPGTIYLE